MTENREIDATGPVPDILRQSRRVHLLKSIGVALFLIVVGLVLAICHYIYCHDDTGLGATILHHFSIAFLVAGIWHATEVFVSRRDFFEVISIILRKSISKIEVSQKRISRIVSNIDLRSGELLSSQGKSIAVCHDISDQVRASRYERIVGFLRLYTESHPELYNEIISAPGTLTMVMNNGHIWIQSHSDELRERFKDKSKKTRLIVIQPESQAAALMEAKEILQKGSYQQKLHIALTALKIMQPDPNCFEIYGVALPIHQAIFLSDSRLLIVPRFVLESSAPPVFEFENNEHRKSYYKKVVHDIEHLLKHPETKKIMLPS